jgi:hypothetical protein
VVFPTPPFWLATVMIILVRNDFTGLGAAPLGKEAKFQISN